MRQGSCQPDPHTLAPKITNIVRKLHIIRGRLMYQNIRLCYRGSVLDF